MPTIEFNQEVWGKEYDWSQKGDEWSEPWGSVEAQWNWCIFPRISSFIPVDKILEIAPGYGRWTQFLKDCCNHLDIVDLNLRCIENCQQRFAGTANIEYHVNDGFSLQMIADNSVDFAFSFDSLVHAELDVLESYLAELSHKLTADGVGFFHHSNIGEYEKRWRLKSEIPAEIVAYLPIEDLRLPSHPNRSFSVTSAKFRRACDAVGLSCISQELVNWNHHLLIDAFSTFTRKGSKWDRENKVLRNRAFGQEAKQIAKLSELYNFSK